MEEKMEYDNEVVRNGIVEKADLAVRLHEMGKWPAIVEQDDNGNYQITRQGSTMVRFDLKFPAKLTQDSKAEFSTYDVLWKDKKHNENAGMLDEFARGTSKLAEIYRDFSNRSYEGRIETDSKPDSTALEIIMTKLVTSEEELGTVLEDFYRIE